MKIKCNNKTINIDDNIFYSHPIVKDLYINTFAYLYKIPSEKAEKIINDYYLFEDYKDDRIIINMLNYYSEDLYDYFENKNNLKKYCN